MRINIETNAREIVGKLTDVAAKQIPFATALTITRLAKTSQETIKNEMRRVFNNPTSYALRSLYVKAANKRTLEAEVGLKDQEKSKAYSPAQTLGHEFTGGPRRQKRIEFWLMRSGLISAGEFVVPGDAAKLDRFGNMSRGQVQQIMSQIKVGSDSNAYASKSARSKRNQKRAGLLFWSRGGKLPRGVWMRDKADVLPILIVVKRATYRQAINLPQVVQQIVGRDFSAEFSSAFNEAVKNAR